MIKCPMKTNPKGHSVGSNSTQFHIFQKALKCCSNHIKSESLKHKSDIQFPTFLFEIKMTEVIKSSEGESE